MAYKIEQIEGIGESYARKLESIGISTTEQLLTVCAKKSGREKVSEQTGISEKLILQFSNHSLLFPIQREPGQFAELHEAAGVDTVKEFRHRVAANLYPRFVEVNGQKHLCGRVPSETELAGMIEQAKELPPIVTY